MVVAPLWYLLRGSYQEFWSGWWTYARYSSTATGRGMRGQLVLGWDQAYDYYQRFPLSFVVIAALVATTLLLWRDYSYRVRMLRIGTIVWVGAAWLELAVSQRYSSHYYSILAVPTWIAFALLAADAERSLRERGHQLRRVAAVPVVATICFVFVGGATPLMDGVARASHFTSIGQLTEQRAVAAPIRVEEAVLDLVSAPNDALLAWTNEPWPYLDRHRVSATRFIWKSFLLGEVYLAGSGPQYVLPHTWEWFEEDLEEAQPLAYYQEPDLVPDPTTPFAEYVEDNFRPALAGTDATIFLRRDVADELMDPSDDAVPWVPIGDDVDGWTQRRGSLELRGRAARPPVLDRGWCTRIAGTIDRPGGAIPSFGVVIQGTADMPFSASITVDGGTVTSATSDLNHQQPMSWADGDSSTFAVVVGSRSMALVVDGQVRGAVPINREELSGAEPEVVLTSASSGLSLSDVTKERLSGVGTSGC